MVGGKKIKIEIGKEAAAEKRRGKETPPYVVCIFA